MPCSSVELSTKVINHLKSTYGIDDSNAHGIYDQAINLYHQLLTMIDLNSLRITDSRILSALIIRICEYYYFDELSGYKKCKTKFRSLFFRRLLLSTIMYIITFCQNTEAEYFFNGLVVYVKVKI